MDLILILTVASCKSNISHLPFLLHSEPNHIGLIDGFVVLTFNRKVPLALYFGTLAIFLNGLKVLIGCIQANVLAAMP